MAGLVGLWVTTCLRGAPNALNDRLGELADANGKLGSDGCNWRPVTGEVAVRQSG